MLSCLTKAEQILAIDEKSSRAESSLRQQSDVDERWAPVPVRIVVEFLRSCVVDFDSRASSSLFLPHRYDTCLVPWRERCLSSEARLRILFG